ncbi:lipoyl(octanoyl) transferase LipB [Dyadobacter chenwenxiniae]|uniref:Octanoyltransferase n=1 Tax=Dyadobacter chenwenxiniae TaxID=2906456 RepID=A0A9X1PQF3_9BACT|nr:lipoyl(octanoyl) transferase LipB [Dyadobacter chenwenxiniae]MCF0065535.1 lipoyl(octanoyl) transferase LipB [Dyadobacter chenwenxiniae]UON85445.1 lipoyl(octanoyl) transferase LipB [Dyadobacter chenwenxiniae]
MRTKTYYVDKKVIPHQTAVDFQIEERAKIILLKTQKFDTSESNLLILCEHYPILTCGSSAKESHLLIDRSELPNVGLEISTIKRGGAITFHGPGQIVGYPILDLENFKTDIRWYIETLANVIIDTLGNYNISGYYDHEFPGVWIYDEVTAKKKKICAVGVHLSRWVTNHGFALNVNNNMSFYQYFIPCSIDSPDRETTSLSREIGFDVSITEVKKIIMKNFQKYFSTELI